MCRFTERYIYIWIIGPIVQKVGVHLNLTFYSKYSTYQRA